MFEATEPEARAAPDPDESYHALLLLVKRVGVDAGRELWNTLFVSQQHFREFRPALMSAYNGKPGRQVWLFPFKVPRAGQLSTRWTMGSEHSILHDMFAGFTLQSAYMAFTQTVASGMS